MPKSFIRSSSIVAAMTFLSRILGLVRDFVIARYFGANGLTDAFLVAFRIPNFFRRLFAEGAFSQAFLPILADVKANKSDKEVQLVINHIATKLLSILMIITLISVILAPIIIFLFAWGFYFNTDLTQFNLASNMLRITFPYLLLISLTALSGAILNTYDNFTIPAFTPVLLNISLILCAIYLSKFLSTPIMALAWGVLIGGILQLIFQIPFLRKLKKLPKIQFGNHKALSTLKKRMLPALFGVSVSQINLLVDTMIASTLISGSVSWLYYSDRLLELPLALIGITLATVALARLSNYHAQKDTKNFLLTINKALLFALILGFPACFGLIFLSQELIITLFQYDAFDLISAKKTALSLQAYGSGLMAFILIKIFAPVFLSMGDTKTPVKAGVVAMTSNIVLNLILVQYFGHVGLAVATSISALINAALLYFFLVKQSIYKFNNAFYKMLIKVLFATIIMALYIIYFESNIDLYIDSSMIERAFLVSKTILVSALIYFASLFTLGVRLKKL